VSRDWSGTCVSTRLLLRSWPHSFGMAHGGIVVVVMSGSGCLGRDKEMLRVPSRGTLMVRSYD
jgi:hypothetical protein